MKKKLTSALMLLLTILLLFSATGCSRDEREKKYLRLGLSEDAAGLNLLLIGKLAGTQKLSTYVYFDSHAEDGYADRVIAYMEDAHGLDAAYFEESDVPAILAYNETAKDPLRLIFIDSFNEDGSIHGFYMAKESWISVRTRDYRKFVNGLLSSAKYRYENSNVTAGDDVNAMKNYDRDAYRSVYDSVCALKLSGNILFQESRYSVENNIELQTTTEQFIALYEIDNLTYDALTKKFKSDAETQAAAERFEAVSFSFMSIESYLEMFAGMPEDTEENLAKAAADRTYVYDPDCAANESLEALFGVSAGDDLYALDMMVNQMYQVVKEKPAAKKNYTKAIVIVTAAALLVTAAALTFIIKKSRSGMKFSWKKVLFGENQ